MFFFFLFFFQFANVSLTMKTCLFCFLLVLSTQSFSTQNLIPFAMREIIRDFYVNQSESFDFIIYGNQSEKIGQFVTDIIKVKSGDVFAYKLIQVKEGKEEFLVYRSAILFFDSIKSYQDFHARALLGTEHFFKLLVYIIDFDDSNIENFAIIQAFHLFRFETFVTHTLRDDSLRLITFVAFQQPICHKFVPFQINKFLLSKRKWKTQEYFIEKFKNYNGCMLYVNIPFQNFPFTSITLNQNYQVTSLKGVALAIQYAISKKLNHSTFYNFYDLETKNHLYPSVKCDYGLFVHPMRQPEYANSALIQPIIAVDWIIIASRGSTYSNFEKVFLPFEHEVWFCLTVTISVGVFTIFALKLMSKKVQDYVFGSKVSTPLLCFL